MQEESIVLDHGSGGRMSHELIAEYFVSALDNEPLKRLNDSAVVDIPSGRIALSTDSYTVDPIFFPGGDIGSLAVHGTVNDIAMSGARPVYLTVGFILEEGFPMDDLRRILQSMSRAAREAGVKVVAGDTKVVPRGKADKIFINTAGVGVIERNVTLGGECALAGDAVLVSGAIGDHGACVLASREGLSFSSPVVSDSASLNGLVELILDTADGVHVLRDPTRGGLATTLNEIALQSGVGVEIDEDRVPYRESVLGMCEILGLDPLYLANEGKLIAIVQNDQAEALLAAMRSHELGRESRIIGRVAADHPGKVVMNTAVGGRRILDMLIGEQLPRIC